MNTDPNLLDVATRTLDPTRADVRVCLRSPKDDVELRGRLMGPRCRFANTIEVAYPLRRVGSTSEYSAIIPEPQLWDPISPFLYEGPIEVWQAGELLQKTWVRRCFHSLKQTSKGLTINGQPLVLKGIQFPPGPQVRYSEPARVEIEPTLLELRGQGFNALLVDCIPAALQEWADRLGFLIFTDKLPPHISFNSDGTFAFPCLDS